jgi:hypothetical protein
MRWLTDGCRNNQLHGIGFMKLRKYKDTWLRRVARSYRELGLLAAIVAAVTGIIVAAFFVYPWLEVALDVLSEFVISIRHAIGPM